MGIRKAAFGVALLGALGLWGGTAVGQQAEPAPLFVPPNMGRGDLPSQPPDVPYVPTPQVVVDAMLELGGVKSGDVLYDLGSGDGRIPVTAAKTYGVRAVGIDIDPQRISEANANAKEAGVTGLVTFRQADLFKQDLREANVVTLYLLPSLNVKLQPKLLAELKPGSRIVSHAFDMGDWKPDATQEVEGSTIYLWTVPRRPAR